MLLVGRPRCSGSIYPSIMLSAEKAISEAIREGEQVLEEQMVRAAVEVGEKAVASMAESDAVEASMDEAERAASETALRQAASASADAVLNDMSRELEQLGKENPPPTMEDITKKKDEYVDNWDEKLKEKFSDPDVKIPFEGESLPSMRSQYDTLAEKCCDGKVSEAGCPDTICGSESIPKGDPPITTAERNSLADDASRGEQNPEVAQPSSPQQTTKRFYEDGNPSGAEAGSGEAGSPAANERDANNKAAEEKPCTKGESCLNPNSKSAMGDKEAQNLKDSGKLEDLRGRDATPPKDAEKTIWKEAKNWEWLGQTVKWLILGGLGFFAAYEIFKAWGELKTGCYATVTTTKGSSNSVQVTSGKDATCPPSYKCMQCSPPPSTAPPSCDASQTLPSKAGDCSSDKPWTLFDNVYQAPCNGDAIKSCCCAAELTKCDVAGDQSTPEGCNFCISANANSDGLYAPLASGDGVVPNKRVCDTNKGIWTSGIYKNCDWECGAGNVLDNAEKLASEAWNAGVGLAEGAAKAATWLARHLGLILGSAAGLIVFIIIMIVIIKAVRNKKQTAAQQSSLQYGMPPQRVGMMPYWRGGGKVSCVSQRAYLQNRSS